MFRVGTGRYPDTVSEVGCVYSPSSFPRAVYLNGISMGFADNHPPEAHSAHRSRHALLIFYETQVQSTR